MKTCDECGGKHFAKGKCRVHYRMPSQIKKLDQGYQSINRLARQGATKPIIKTYSIPKVSTKQLERLKKYKKLRDAYMDSNEACEANIEGCTGISTELHHKCGRDGDNLFNHFMALCSNCHHKIEIGGSWVYEKEFKIKRTEN